MSGPAGIYVHLPYCRSRCGYCAFVVSTDDSTRDDSGAIVGDLAPDVWDVAGWVAPNPGGVGPMTRAMLLSNVVDFSEAALAADRPR